jgi:FtsP/CotA-like multicopper oxidase with cupredoxin domain
MGERAVWRSRRALIFVTAAAIVVAAGAAGAFAGGLIGGTAVEPQVAPRAHAAAAAGAGVVRQGVKRPAAHPAKAAPVSSKRAGRSRPVRHRPATSAPARRLSTGGGPTYDLCVKAGSLSLPGASVGIWGFASLGTAASCAGVSAQLPGPQLDANVGDTVTLNVTNTLDRTITIEAPGIDFGSAVTDVLPTQTVSLSFTAGTEGTYLYESSGDAGRQEAMGLYGALVVHAPAGVVDGMAVSVAVERTLVLSEVDPNLNANPDGFNMNDWHPTYWLINGKAYPETDSIGAAAGQNVLLRYANAGIDNTTMTMLGVRQQLLALDGSRLGSALSVVAQTFPSGGTGDAIVAVPATATAGTKYPVYNRNLQLENGTLGPGGGMLTYIRIP